MFVTERDKSVVQAVCNYYTLTRAQIGRLCFPTDPDGRLTRARLQKLLDAGLVNRTHMLVVNPAMGNPAPVYYPSRAGCQFLAEILEDARYLSVCTQTPNWQHLYHWIAVAETHILFDQAAAYSGSVAVENWTGEWDVINAEATLPEKRYKLYTLLCEEPRLVCAPDAGFLLAKGNFKKVFYLELDRDTTQGPSRVVARKAKGYAGLAEQEKHRRHFPAANVERFMTLVIAPTPHRRNALREAFRQAPEASLWRFASIGDLTAENLFYGPVFYKCEGEGVSLLRPEVTA